MIDVRPLVAGRARPLVAGRALSPDPAISAVASAIHMDDDYDHSDSTPRRFTFKRVNLESPSPPCVSVDPRLTPSRVRPLDDDRGSQRPLAPISDDLMRFSPAATASPSGDNKVHNSSVKLYMLCIFLFGGVLSSWNLDIVITYNHIYGSIEILYNCV